MPDWASVTGRVMWRQSMGWTRLRHIAAWNWHEFGAHDLPRPDNGAVY